MKKTSKKLKKRNKQPKLTSAGQLDERTQWVRLLEHISMFHMQMVKEMHSPIIGAEVNEDELFHRASASAIEDCILLIEMLDHEGWFGNDEDLPQHKQGPAG